MMCAARMMYGFATSEVTSGTQCAVRHISHLFLAKLNTYLPRGGLLHFAPKAQYFIMRAIIQAIDPHAFVTISDVADVFKTND